MDCGFRSCAERLLRFMDAVGINACNLLGTSHGGAVVMLAAAIAPERTRRLILVDPVNPWSARGRTLSVLLSSPLVALAFRKFAPRFPLLQRFYFRRLFGDARRIRPGTLEGYIKPLRRPGALDYGLSILRSWNRDLQELESVLPRISRIPTLLIWGSRDVAVDPGSAAHLQAQFRDCRLLLLEGVGHLPYEEEPEQFNRTVVEFLANNDPSD
jgi:pimeloyl-ACP methyl ester carboxylesterase